MSRYKVKPQYLKYAAKLIGEEYNTSESLMVSIEFPKDGEYFRILKEAGVLELWCEEVKNEWKDWNIKYFFEHNDETGADELLGKKISLLARMQCWANFHNKLDGFVPDWSDTLQNKYGIEIDSRKASVSRRTFSSSLLFHISVSSEERAEQMLSYFKSDIQELIDLKLI